MPNGKMHADEVAFDAALVRRFLAAQFRHWAELPIERVPSAGTDSAFYRLRPDLAVRLPRRPGTTGVRRAIDALRGAIDVEALTTAWETAFRAAEWPGAPVWIHGAWAGARGWASSIALPSYLQTKPVVVAASRRLVSAVVADHRRGAS